MVIIESNGLYPFSAFCIPEKFAKKAEKELMENEENRTAALQQLKEFIGKEKDLASCRTDEEFLLQFLRARKFNVARAFSLLKKFMNFKKKNMDIFTGMDYDVLSKLIKEGVFGFLPYRCEEGCAVLAIHLNNWDPAVFNITDICRGVVMFLFHSICDPLSQVNGYKILFDVKSPGFKHLRFCTPTILYLLYNGTQECFPGRFKGIHIINMSLTFKAAWAFIYPFLSEKLRKRIFFHNDFTTLQDYFPDTFLPVDFGGQLKSYDNIPWLKDAMQAEHLDKLAN